VTPRQRILATIRGEPVDKVAIYHVQFSGHAASVILGRPDVCIGGAHNQWLEMNSLWEGADAHAEFVARCESDAFAITEACGMDMLRLDYWRWRQKPAKKIDDRTFGFGDPDGDWYTLTYDVETELFTRKTNQRRQPATANMPAEPSEQSLKRQVAKAEQEAESCAAPRGPDAKLKARIDKYPQYLVRHGGGTVCINMNSPPELMSAALWPELYARLLMARARVLAVKVPAMAAAGLEVNVAGADFCSAKGPSVAPETYRRVVAPALKVIVDACHARGMHYFYTSDGNFWPVADDMFNVAGVDGWMETDRSAGMDLRLLRQRYPAVTFQGNIRSQVLHRGTVDDVRREALGCVAVARELGGVIVGVSNLIMPGTPPENILALLRTIEDNR